MSGPWETIQLLLCGGIMLGIVGQFWWKGRLVRQSKSWPSTPGEIIQSRVARESNSDGRYYTPKIAYRYSAQGRAYEADTVQIGADGISGSRKQAKQTVARYPVGSQALVYFDPERPERACLERRGAGGWVGYVLAVIYPVLLFSLFILMD